MDTSGYYPQLSDDDPLFEMADYTQLLKTKLLALQANCTTLTGLTNTDAPIAVRDGLMVHVTGRFNRTSAINGVMTIPVGYRPTRNIFVPGVLAGAFVLVQVNTVGDVVTPFSTATGDLMISLCYATSTTVFP